MYDRKYEISHERFRCIALGVLKRVNLSIAKGTGGIRIILKNHINIESRNCLIKSLLCR
jgi:hypothetical protein